MKDNLILNTSFQFSLKTIELYKKLINQQEFIISKQLLRSSTSIGANVFESAADDSQELRPPASEILRRLESMAL